MLGRRYTRNPESPLQKDNPRFFFFTWTELVKFCQKNFFEFFLLSFLLTVVSKNLMFSPYMYILFPFSLFSGL